MEHAFGGEAFTLGMEEELLLVDQDTHRLAHVSTRIVPRVDVPAGEVKHDVYEALVETATPICRDAGEAAGHLRDLRGALQDAGATLIGAGIHPDGAFGDLVHVPEPRYAEVAAQLRGLLRRTPTCALHVHVGMPDAETAVTALNRIRVFLPLLQALAANSPFWHGTDSGFDTARAQLFRGYPRAVIPREFAGWDDYVRVVDAIVAAGDLPDYTFFWWDARLHPKLGTLEVRAMDAQSDLRTVQALGSLVHALAVACAREEPPSDIQPVEAISESSFRAGRDGLASELWWRGELRPVAEIAADALDWSGAPDRDAIDRILHDGNGADRQRAAHAAGGMDGLLAALAAEARV
jgi:carboxylate-amine ligase